MISISDHGEAEWTRLIWVELSMNINEEKS